MKYLILILLVAALLWIAAIALPGRRRSPSTVRDKGGDGGGSGDSGGYSSTSCDGSDGGCGGGDGGGGD